MNHEDPYPNHLDMDLDKILDEWNMHEQECGPSCEAPIWNECRPHVKREKMCDEGKKLYDRYQRCFNIWMQRP